VLTIFKLLFVMIFGLQFGVMAGWTWLQAGLPCGHGMLLGSVAGLLVGALFVWPRKPKPDRPAEGADAFARDLALYKEGRLSLDAFVDRWSGRVPKKSKVDKDTCGSGPQGFHGWHGGQGVQEFRAGPQGFQGPRDLQGCQGFQGPWWPIFKLGDWVRIPGGELAQVVGIQSPGGYEPLIQVATRVVPRAFPLVPRAFPPSRLVQALPRKGEWWKKRKCSTIHHLERDHFWADRPVCWEYDDSHPGVIEAVKCGCLAPVNYGRGTSTISDEPPKFQPGQWCRIRPSYRGMGLLAQIIGRSHLEGPGDERYEMMTADGQMELGDNALEPALPRKGEWWTDNVWYASPVCWRQDDDRSCVAAEVKLGRIVPVNFGRGPA